MSAMAQATPATTAPIGNDWLHPSLAQYDSGRNWEHAHQDIEVHGFAISDSSTTRVGSGQWGNGPDQIWVGYGGMEGRWMAPEEVLELSRALMLVAHAHIQRVYVKQCAALGIATAIEAAKAQATTSTQGGAA